MNIVQNNGEVAGQTVHHFHMHVIPRHAGDDVQVTWKQGETESESLKALADAIKKHI
jgi:histidine triad (HIT) family protein